MLRKCHGHGLTKGVLNETAGGIFLYKSPNQAFQFLDDEVLFKLDWSTKSQNKHHQKFVAFVNGSDSNRDNSLLMEKLEALTIKIESQFQSLKEEMHEMHKNYNNRGGNQNRNSHDLFSHQSHHDPNDSEKSLTDLNNDVKNDLEDFKRCIRSMRTVHSKLYERDDQSKTDLEKTITKFLDGQRVANMFVKDNINDMILKMKQNEKNFQTIFKDMERKIDEWEKSQNISSEQTDITDPPPPHAHTEQVNVIFTKRGKSDDSPKIQTLPPITVKDKPIKTSKRGYYVVKTNDYPFREYIPKTPYPQRLNVDHSHLNRVVKAGNLVAPELVLDHHLLDRSEHSLLVLRSPKYHKSKKNMLDEEEVLCQP
ncbi:hypothetical protein Tco_1047286 [Tanacetum coccineum]